MLFNSIQFLALYLPITMVGFFWLGARSKLAAAWWLAIASLVFYAGWSWRYVPLLLCSVGFNFVFGSLIARSSQRPLAARVLLAGAVAANLLLLGYFKYADFFIANWNWAFHQRVDPLHLILPLGISFFTFTQIAFLVDTSKGIATEPRFSHYLLFVTYFPHLIAGPVLHHKEMMPQFGSEATYRFSWHDVAVGLAIFAIGLFKKTVLADGIAPHVGSAFAAAGRGDALHLLQAWGGALAYSLQLYFDFSGYSDMAIGLSRMFGVKLPLNFDSPYKARNISDFWRRWHMTLSRFLRDYLYVPLGGNRHGSLRRYVNLVITMFLGGLWHGAAWTFAVWGLLHGAYLAVNHGFQALKPRLPRFIRTPRLAAVLSIGLTYLVVVFGWVFFRAESLPAAFAILVGMFGGNGIAIPDALLIRAPALVQSATAALGIRPELGGGTEFVVLWTKIVLLHVIVFAMPNTQQIMCRFQPALDFREPGGGSRLLVAAFDLRSAMAIGALGGLGLLAMSRHSEFLYYQF
jgi:alginate O-acetyltransferase complex protein AlgI